MRRSFLLSLLVALFLSALGGYRESTLALARPQSTAARAESSKEVSLLMSYLIVSEGMHVQVGPSDTRPPNEIFADLKSLPKSKRLGLRAYVQAHAYLPKAALDVIGQLLPEDHREFLLRAIEDKRWCGRVIQCLAERNEVALVPQILDHANAERLDDFLPLADPQRPEFLDAVRRKHAAKPSERTAFVLGAYGFAVEKEIRACAASPDKALHQAALFGLLRSRDSRSLSLMLELANLSDEGEWSLVANRFILEGTSHVDELLKWLDESSEKERVAAYALARIKSDIGVARVLDRYGDKPFDNPFAAESARSSPMAARDFVMSRGAHGTREQKLNALLIAHHLVGYDRPEPGKEHPLLAPLLQATHDSDAEVRYEAAKTITEYAYDAQYSEGRKALRRLVEMLSDSSPRVRGEAAIQVSQYPSPEVLALLKAMAADKTEDTHVRDSASRAAQDLEDRLSHLSQTGNKRVYLNKGVIDP